MKQIPLLAIIVMPAILTWVGYGSVVQSAESRRVPTGAYVLDTGDTVRWWIDEERALLCESIESYAGGIGLSCLPLTATTYNWPALVR